MKYLVMLQQINEASIDVEATDSDHALIVAKQHYLMLPEHFNWDRGEPHARRAYVIH